MQVNPKERFKMLLNRVASIKQPYVRVFSTEAGKGVLRDLAKFCKAGESTFSRDSRESARMEGRREVYLRILNFVKLSDEELTEIVTGVRRKGDNNE